MGSFALLLLLFHAPFSVLHLCCNPKLFASGMCHSSCQSEAALQREQDWVLEARRHVAMGVVWDPY